jgi:hypothetical protein
MDDGMCWSRSGSVGTLFGQPAYIEGGQIGVSIDEDIRATPWTGTGWGATCALRLDFRRVFTLTETHCADRVLCRTGANQAVAIATKYNSHRDGTEELSIFEFGPGVIQVAREGVERARRTLKELTDTPTFPTFGDDNDTNGGGFSYSGFTFFPLMLGGKAYVGAIGRSGIGWREDNETLLAIYREDGGELTPLASYVVDLSHGAVTKTAVREIRPEPKKTRR